MGKCRAELSGVDVMFEAAEMMTSIAMNGGRGDTPSTANSDGPEQHAFDAWGNSEPPNMIMNARSREEFVLGVAGSGSDVRWVLIWLPKVKPPHGLQLASATLRTV